MALEAEEEEEDEAEEKEDEAEEKEEEDDEEAERRRRGNEDEGGDDDFDSPSHAPRPLVEVRAAVDGYPESSSCSWRRRQAAEGLRAERRERRSIGCFFFLFRPRLANNL